MFPNSDVAGFPPKSGLDEAGFVFVDPKSEVPVVFPGCALFVLFVDVFPKDPNSDVPVVAGFPNALLPNMRQSQAIVEEETQGAVAVCSSRVRFMPRVCRDRGGLLLLERR